MEWSLTDELDHLKSVMTELGVDPHSTESLLLRLADATPGVIYVFIRATNMTVFVTPEIHSILGYGPEEWTQDPEIFSRTVHPDDVATIEEHHRELDTLPDDGYIQTIQRMRHKDGSWRSLSCRESVFAHDEHGTPVLIIGHARDITDEAHTERALRESELQARAMLDAIPDLMFWFSADGTILSCHPHTSEYFFEPPERFLGKKVSEVLPAEIVETTEEHIRAALETDEIQIYEYSIQLHGETRFWEARMVASGESQVLTIVRDITERKRAENRLLESETKYRRFFETSRDAVFITSRDGRWIDANQAAVELFRCDSLEQLMSTRVSDRYANPAEREVHLRTIERQGFSREYPVDLLTIDGRIIHTLITSVPMSDEQGAIVAFQGTIRDITEQRRAEMALRESETRYRLLVERNVAGIYRSTVDGELLECNQAFATIFGFDSRTEALEHGAANLYRYQRDRELFIDELRRSGHVNAWELDLLRRDRQPVKVILSAVLLEDESGTPSIIEGSLIDVTALRRLEERLHRSRRLEAVGKLAGGIAHDFNNILQAMYMQIELGLSDVQDVAMEKRLRSLLQGTERARNLIRQLLAFGRRQRLDLQAVDLNEVLRGLISMLDRVIPESIEIHFEPGVGIDPVQVDVGQLERVVTNLAINARDAMSDGGTLTISTEARHLDAEDCTDHDWAEPGEYVVLTLADTGAGMDPETQQRAFEPFFTTKEPGLGTGLGLATVHGIVGQHRGGIEVISEPNRGTRVSVFLRAARQNDDTHPDDVDDHDEIAPVRGGGETILLAEDDASVLEVAATVLEGAGYSVLRATDGAEAVELARKKLDDIDLVVLDLIMPRTGGREALREIREIRPDLPALFSSGYSDDLELVGTVSGADVELLHKPYRPDVLLRRIRRLLDRSQ